MTATTPIDRLRKYIDHNTSLTDTELRELVAAALRALDALEERLREQVETNMELAGLAGQQQLDAIALQARLDAATETLRKIRKTNSLAQVHRLAGEQGGWQ